MFPEITRDEVFRIETRRLWLRWPTRDDAADIAALAAQKHDRDGARPHLVLITETAALGTVDRWRAEAEAGTALHLMLVPKTGERRVIGVVHVAPGRDGMPELDYCLHADWRGQGLMTEAAQAAVDMAFLLGAVRHVAAAPRVLDGLGRRVLERCGFTFVGTGLGRAGGHPGLAACDMFCLDRKTWQSLKGWNAPDYATAAVPLAEGTCSDRVGPETKG